MSRTESPGVYEIINIDYVESCQVITGRDGSLTALVRTAAASFVLDGAEAIDLLSSMGISAPGYHPGSLATQGKDSIPV